ncbi:MAG TPA: YceH family protein [Terracidiphilus sp.]|nr:YceH family protein [Terracidiphilus sp.]
MPILITPAEARVLGSLIEKEVSTPEYYPLSLNALVNACNQKNNREPVMHLEEQEVRDALRALEDQQFAGAARNAESRVTKYEHRLQEIFNFTRGETAILCELLLRGAQTPGELRNRTDRLYQFEEVSDVISVLQRLAQREPALVAALPRQPGAREIRYTHLLSGEPDMPSSSPAEPTSGSSTQDRISHLESEFAQLRQELNLLRDQLSALTGGPS